MSTRIFLVARSTKQCVEVAASGGYGLRGTQKPRALALFCYAHRGEAVEVLGEDRLDGEFENEWSSAGGLQEWHDEDAKQRFKALTGRDAPETD